jgi:hypothetical protein
MILLSGHTFPGSPKLHETQRLSLEFQESQNVMASRQDENLLGNAHSGLSLVWHNLFHENSSK